VHDLLSRGVKGEVIRLALMSARYNEPFDWSQKLLDDSEKMLNRMYRQVAPNAGGTVHPEVLDALRDNLNTPKALALLQTLNDDYLLATANFLGLLRHDAEAWFQGEGEDTLWIDVQIAARNDAKKARDFATSDAIRDALKAKGIILEDNASGTTWRRV
jgi:cysteinyl-tRNA synthetase